MRRLAVDGTNERYFAQRVRKDLGCMVPVEIVIGSERIELPGQQDPLNFKQHLGALLVADLDDNRLLLPPERYVREDFRLVKKEKGQFVCEPDGEGRHGDTFDSTKLALWALSSTGGAITDPSVIRMGSNFVGPGNRPAFLPRRTL